jgi:hypothetical protein
MVFMFSGFKSVMGFSGSNQARFAVLPVFGTRIMAGGAVVGTEKGK